LKTLGLISLLLISRWASALEYKAATCNDSDFTRGAWQDLSSQEELIGRHLRDIGQHSGDTGEIVYLTNCRVKWPVDEKGQSVDGMRTVVMDKVWKVKNLTYHAGMKILYSLVSDTTYQPDGSSCAKRSRLIRGFSFCRTARACDELGVPTAVPTVVQPKPSPVPPTELEIAPQTPPLPDQGPLRPGP